MSEPMITERQSAFRNSECPYQHLSTKHLSAKGLPVDLEAASKSNIGRTALLAKFSEFVSGSDIPAIDVSTFNFDELAKKSKSLNQHSPGALTEIFPVPEARSMEETWARVGQTGSRLVGYLAKRHAEVFSLSANHSVAAHVVMREIADKSNVEIWNYLKTRHNFGDGVIVSVNAKGIPILPEDALAILTYQLIQERWLTRSEIQNLNEMIQSKPQLLHRLLELQDIMCALLKVFFDTHPEYLDGSLAFSEVGLIELNPLNIVPSSRLLKVLLHNLGPWLVEFAQMPVDEQIATAITKAREEKAFEQFIAIIEGHGDQTRFLGVYRKVCPAKNSLVRIFKSLIERKERLNG